MGNISRIARNVYLRLRSERLNSSSQLDPQNCWSIEMGVEHIMQCLCFGIEAFCSCFMYLDMAEDWSVIGAN